MPAEAEQKSGGASDETPMAVVEEQKGMLRILQANPAATEAGILPGQSANAALALLPGLHLEERSELKEQQRVEMLAQWLEQFSSSVTIASGDLLLFEVAGSLRLFGGLRRLRQQVARGLQQQGIAVSLAIAPTPLAATWFARAAERVCIRDASNLLPTLRRLSLTALGWPAATVETLTGMGVRTVGDCLKLPRDGFARRVGAARLLDLDRATGRLPDPRHVWRSPEVFCADYELLEEQHDRDQLLAMCHELLHAYERFLLTRQLGAQQLYFSFYHLRSAATTLSLGCVQADRSAHRWADLLAIRFERLVLPEPVIAIRLQGGHVEPLQETSQSLRLQSEQRPVRTSVTQLIERLSARLGAALVGGVASVAEHRPQHAWRTRNLLTTSESSLQPFTCYGQKRPLWLLSEPALLCSGSEEPLHLGRLTLLEGPERLETGWWDDDAIARDYYTAINTLGMRLWIFRHRGSQPDWYLHGFFG